MEQGNAMDMDIDMGWICVIQEFLGFDTTSTSEYYNSFQNQTKPNTT